MSRNRRRAGNRGGPAAVRRTGLEHPSDTADYTDGAAEAGLWLLRDAHDKWLAEYDAAVGTHGDPEHHRAVALRLHQHAASVVTWTRALDELCGGDPVPRSSYQAARVGAHAELMAGARYACHRCVHQLLTLTRSEGGISGSWSGPLVLDEVGLVHWAEEWRLPTVSSERPTEQRYRQHYVARFAGRSMFGTLAELRGWFDQQLP